jgi:hypothetical protein
VSEDEEAGSAKLPQEKSPSMPRSGSRQRSLGSTPSTGKVPPLSACTSLRKKYSSVPGIDRDPLHAGLAEHVLETAKGTVNRSAAADGANHGTEQQSLEGTGLHLSLKTSSVNTVQRYLLLEMGSSYLAAATSDSTHKFAQ